MFHIEDVLQLKDNENVRLVVRRHLITLLPNLLLSLFLIVVPFFLLFPLFSWGIAGMGLFLTAVLAGVVIAVRAFVLWDADVLVITTLRLVDVDQRGIFSRFVTEVALTSIKEASWHRHGFVETLFQIGSLTVQTENSEPMLIKRISHPEQVRELINDLRNATSPKRIDLSPEMRERLRKLNGLLEELSLEDLDRVEKQIREIGRSQAVENFLDKDESVSS